jgi:hypothetical protein
MALTASQPAPPHTRTGWDDEIVPALRKRTSLGALTCLCSDHTDTS